MVSPNPSARNAAALRLSIVLCTHNPKPRLLKLALESIAAQDLPREQFETILIDNASTPPLQLEDYLDDTSLEVQVIREPRPGLTLARIAAIQAAQAELFLFVDDDNELAANYATTALRIAAESPTIGAFGGVTEGAFERPYAAWKEELLPYLGVRNYGSEPITSDEQKWGEWDPIGAGMVTRRDVAERFVGFVGEHDIATGLGRRGKILMSGEDTLLARCANWQGYSCSYQPSLHLRHHISPGRLRTGYLKRLLEGHGRSFVLLERIQGRTIAPIGGLPAKRYLARRWVQRVQSEGRAGTVTWRWDVGYVRESGADTPKN